MSTTNEELLARSTEIIEASTTGNGASSGALGEGGPQGPSGGEAASTGSIGSLILRVFLENKLAIVGVALVILMLLFSFVGPLIYHTNQIAVNLADTTLPPSSSHVLGTDPSGFDVLGRLMYAGQSSLEVGLAAAAMATLIGVVWGAVAGFFGGIIDAVMMRVVDVLLSIPALFLLIVLAVIFTPGKVGLIFIIGGLAWLTPARLVRGETLTLRTREYVQAVRVMGGKNRRMVLRHIIPNAIGTIVVNATFQVADAILVLAALSFLGLGIQYPQADWGSMLSDGSQYVLTGYWWLIVPAGVCIVVVVVAFNFIGDALRDSLEVRLQQR
jgi:peptide/nickel transport system permease protein